MKAKIQNNAKNNIIIGLGVLVVSLLAMFSFSGAKASSGIVGAEEFMTKYKETPGAMLVDVRTPGEFEAGHIKDAINIDFQNSNFEQEIQKLDTSKTYFIYCRSGNRSGQAAGILKKNNLQNVYDLQGGISKNPQLLK